MVCGTASDAGKSHVVTGLCRLLARRGVRVAPFKAQNMALNSYVTADGHEIGRAQGVQALAAGAEPEVAMNPILLKPTGERTSQVVVMGRPVAHLDAVAYHARKPELMGTVLAALADLRRRFDVVVCEGAGSPAEINLLDHDIVNLAVARRSGMGAIIVGDIDRGGVFASLYGTVALLPPELRELVRGFVINKFRGDPALLSGGLAELEHRTGLPTLGVIPWLHDVALDAEDSMALDGRRPRPSHAAVAGSLDIAAVRFPRISNFTDLDALAIEPGVGVRLVTRPGELGDPDVVVLPGTKATVADLEWLRGTGLDSAVGRLREAGTPVFGICGGYQMMGRTISDAVESGRGTVGGLGWLDASTTFGEAKIVRQRRGRALGHRVSGYEIHHGVVSPGTGAPAGIQPGTGADPAIQPGTGAAPWIQLDDIHGTGQEGLRLGSVLGTSLHGIMEADGVRAEFLRWASEQRGRNWVPAGVSFSAAREAQWDRLADALEDAIDLGALERIVAEGVVVP